MTTVTQPIYESTEGMDDLTRQALHRLLGAVADTKLLLGYHYGEWTFGTPELEAAVANCSLSQSELGHVRLLHGVLAKYFGDDPDQLVEERDSSEFANVGFLDRPIETWAGCIAITAVVDFGVTALLDSLRGSTFKPIRMSVDKILDEERYHVHHGRGWLVSWAKRGVAERETTARAAAAALSSTAIWFGPADDAGDAALVAAGIKRRSNAEIMAEVETELSRLGGAHGMSLDTQELQTFSGWNPTTRRLEASGPEPEILYHLRGGENTLFKLGS